MKENKTETTQKTCLAPDNSGDILNLPKVQISAEHAVWWAQTEKELLLKANELLKKLDRTTDDKECEEINEELHLNEIEINFATRMIDIITSFGKGTVANNG
jgi:hypothetical protein